MSRARSIKTFSTARGDKAFELSLVLTILSAHISLILTGEFHPAHALAILLSLLAGAAFFDRMVSVPALVWNCLLVLVLFLSLVAALVPPRDFESYFHGISYFLVYVSSIRYLTRKTERDDLVLLLLCLLEVCAASIMTISLAFLGTLFMFVGCMVGSLMLLALRHEVSILALHSERIEPGDRYEPGVPVSEKKRPFTTMIPRKIFAFSFLSALAIFVLGFGVFFVIPRISRSFFTWRTGIHSRVPGFSETVELGSVGMTKRRHTLVMRVKVGGGSYGPGPLYLRGNALDNYDGRRWSDTLGVKSFSYYRYQDTVALDKMQSLKKSVKQEIIMEPTDGSLLFAIPMIKAVSAPFRYQAVSRYINGYIGFSLGSPIYDRVIYNAWSIPPENIDLVCERDRDPEDDELPKLFRNAYLQMPPGTQRIERLAKSVAGDRASPCEQVRRINDYLMENYTYDLDTPSDQADDPVSDFLFESRRGYCQHFATAAAMMLRGVGIPCRVAAGYLGGEINPIEGYYRIRENDAHTWVEVYLPAGGWMILDPTPPGPLEKPPWFQVKWLRDIFDSARYRWDVYVVDLTWRDQVAMASGMRRRGAMAGRRLSLLPARMSALIRSLVRGRTSLTIIVLALAALYLLWLRPRWSGAESRAKSRVTRLKKEYLRLLKMVEKKGVRRSASETPLELAARLEQMSLPFAAPFRLATEAYQSVRFGNSPHQQHALSAIKEAGECLKKNI